MSPRQPTPARSAAAVLVWVLAIALGSALTWLVVDRVGRTVLESPVSVAEAPDAVTAPTPSPTQPTTQPTPSGTGDGASGAVTGTRSTAGGAVSVSCATGAPELVYARPATGWTVEVGDDEGEVKVEFTRADDEIEVGARCGQEAPVFAVETD